MKKLKLLAAVTALATMFAMTGCSKEFADDLMDFASAMEEQGEVFNESYTPETVTGQTLYNEGGIKIVCTSVRANRYSLSLGIYIENNSSENYLFTAKNTKINGEEVSCAFMNPVLSGEHYSFPASFLPGSIESATDIEWTFDDKQDDDKVTPSEMGVTSIEFGFEVFKEIVIATNEAGEVKSDLEFSHEIPAVQINFD